MSNLRHDNALWNKAARLDRMVGLLRAGRPVAMATAVSREGSDYCLLFDEAGNVLDSPEQGLLEKGAAARLAAGACPALVTSAPLGTLSPDEAEVYGGLERLFLDRLAPASLPLWEALAQALGNGLTGSVVTRLPDEKAPAARAVLLADGRRLGDALPGAVLDAAERLAPELGGLTTFDTADARYVIDPYRPQPALYLLGAGLVCRLTAQLAPMAGLRTVVMDVDADFVNRTRFPDAAEVAVVPEFVGCFAGRTVDVDASIVIATRGHTYDIPALSQALATSAGYIGLMACKADGRARLDILRGQGVCEEALARIHTPIGLPLGGKSPGEIAMSILSEIIQVRSARRR